MKLKDICKGKDAAGINQWYISKNAREEKLKGHT